MIYLLIANSFFKFLIGKFHFDFDFDFDFDSIPNYLEFKFKKLITNLPILSKSLSTKNYSFSSTIISIYNFLSINNKEKIIIVYI